MTKELSDVSKERTFQQIRSFVNLDENHKLILDELILSKRKRSDCGSAETSPNSAKLSRDVTNCVHSREIPNCKVQCPTIDSNSVLPFSNMNKKELRILKMQIAMISDSDGDRPIHIAVVQQNFKLLRKLCTVMIKTAITLDLTNYLRQTPLHLAVMLGNIEIVKLLLKCGSSVTLKDRNGNSAIHLAVKSEVQRDVLCLLLFHPQANKIINSLDYEGYTALHYAVMKRNKTAITCLYRSGANMNVMDGKSGRSVLMHAIMEKNTDMVNHLLHCGVDINTVDYSGRTALELALQVSNEETVKLLEKKLFVEGISNPIQSLNISEDESNCDFTPKRTKKLKSA